MPTSGKTLSRMIAIAKAGARFYSTEAGLRNFPEKGRLRASSCQTRGVLRTRSFLEAGALNLVRANVGPMDRLGVSALYAE